jgi:symplekin
MNEIVRTFALRLLRRLQQKAPVSTGTKLPADSEDVTVGKSATTGVSRTVENGDVEIDSVTGDNMEDGEMPQEDNVQTEYLDGELQLPAVRTQVLQHVELPFALCVKAPDILEEFVPAIIQLDR